MCSLCCVAAELRRTNADVKAIEKQMAETVKSTARRDEELEQAGHSLEQARDKELQLKSQLDVLEEARKNASAKAAENQIGKANDNLEVRLPIDCTHDK